MRKGFLKIALMTAALVLLGGTTAFAGEKADNGGTVFYIDGDGSILLPPGVTHSSDVKQNYARGSLISTAIADITNAGKGHIDILIETLAHSQCDKIYQTAFLERWVEEENDWNQVAMYEFEAYQEDYLDEELTALTSVVTVKDQPAGYYYRVCGAHSVWKNGYSESFSTRTNGVLITKTP